MKRSYRHSRPTISAALLLIWLAVLPSAATAAPFRNGSFENSPLDPGNATRLANGNSDITGWTVQGDSVDYVGQENSASEGARCIDLIGNNFRGGVEQTFDTLPGASYLVTFAMSGHPLGPPPFKVMTVTVASETMKFVFDTNGKTPARMGWTDNQMAFVATQPLTTIKFEADATGQGCCFGPMLDNVRVVQLAPPSSWVGWKYLFFLSAILAVAALLYARLSRLRQPRRPHSPAPTS